MPMTSTLPSNVIWTLIVHFFIPWLDVLWTHSTQFNDRIMAMPTTQGMSLATFCRTFDHGVGSIAAYHHHGGDYRRHGQECLWGGGALIMPHGHHGSTAWALQWHSEPHRWGEDNDLGGNISWAQWWHGCCRRGILMQVALPWLSHHTIGHHKNIGSACCVHTPLLQLLLYSKRMGGSVASHRQHHGKWPFGNLESVASIIKYNSLIHQCL